VTEEEFHMKKILTQYVVCALAVAVMVTLAQRRRLAPGRRSVTVRMVAPK